MFRFRHEISGPNVRVRLFAGPPGQTLAKLGDLVFSADEWEEFKHALCQDIPETTRPTCVEAVSFVDDATELPENWRTP